MIASIGLGGEELARAVTGVPSEPNVFYVPPFNPPRQGNYGKSVLEDPRMPMDYLLYLFGEEVVDIIRRLESELRKAQSGATSEVLQLLIGRDASVRYQIPKHEELVQIQGWNRGERWLYCCWQVRRSRPAE